MALRPAVKQSGIANRENWKIPGKAIINVKTQRPALGDIKNKTASNAAAVQLKRGPSLRERNGTAKPKGLIKSKSETTLKPTQEEPDEPTPMETSSTDSGTKAFSTRLLPANVQDVDADDASNPQLVSEYVNDIYEYLWALENKYALKPNFLGDQPDISAKMRCILIDWLIQVHLRFHLLQETLYLAVNILDRFLQVRKISRKKLQLVGVTSMLVASKYEEMYPPEVGDFAYITDNAFTKEEILKMESVILWTLDFGLGCPLPLHFLRRNSKAGNADGKIHTLAKYLMELTLPEYEFAHYNPSLLAATAFYLSAQLIEGALWTATLVHYSCYKEGDLKPVVQKLCRLILRSEKAKQQAVRTKYASAKFMKISTIPELLSPIVTELAEGKK